MDKFYIEFDIILFNNCYPFNKIIKLIINIIFIFNYSIKLKKGFYYN